MNAISLTWQPEGAFHHVGFVVASIPNSVQGFASMLQADWDEQVFHDPNQGVRVTFLKSRHVGDPLWELWNRPMNNRPCTPSLPRAAACTTFVMSWTIWSRRSLGALVARASLCQQSRSAADASPGSTPETVC